MVTVTDDMKSAGNLAYERIRAAAKDASSEARKSGLKLDSEFAYKRFALERLLQRLTESRFSGRWCLKGGMLMLSLGSFRTTDDMDLTAPGNQATWGSHGIEEVRDAFVEVADIRPVAEDGLTFAIDAGNCSIMREWAENPTVRLLFDATLHTRSGGMPIRVKLDVSHGETIRPGLRTVQLPPSCKGFVPPVIPCYPWEQVVSEKLAAVFDKGMANTRLRDFYDLCILARERSFDLPTLAEAIRGCFADRGHELRPDPVGLGIAFADAKQKEWAKMVSRPGYSVCLGSLAEAQAEVRAFVVPALHAAMAPEPSPGEWEPGRGWALVEPTVGMSGGR